VEDLHQDEESRGKQSLLSDAAAASASGEQNLGFVAGTIVRDKLPAFERLLWRTTRGNLFIKNVPIAGLVRDPLSVRAHA
jgi:V-type H+-transporting ATPase subunit a